MSEEEKRPWYDKYEASMRKYEQEKKDAGCTFFIALQGYDTELTLHRLARFTKVSKHQRRAAKISKTAD
jgi:hypothetical protein